VTAWAPGPARGERQRIASTSGISTTSNDLRALLDASPVAIVEFDRGGVVREWNPAAWRLLGWAADDVVGATLPSAVFGRQLDLDHLLSGWTPGSRYRCCSYAAAATTGGWWTSS
jgi:PAS domain-containing protein